MCLLILDSLDLVWGIFKTGRNPRKTRGINTTTYSPVVFLSCLDVPPNVVPLGVTVIANRVYRVGISVDSLDGNSPTIPRMQWMWPDLRRNGGLTEVQHRNDTKACRLTTASMGFADDGQGLGCGLSRLGQWPTMDASRKLN